MQSQVIKLPHLSSSVHRAEFDPAFSLSAIVAHATSLARQAGERTSLDPASAQYIRRVIAARAARRRFFNDELFADPAWDILLELYALHCEQRRTSISKLSILAAVPSTTALRWIEKLHNDGLIERQEDHLDARRMWVVLSTKGVVAMRSYFEEIGAENLPL